MPADTVLKGKRAAIYARYSSDMQRDESIDAQLRIVTDYAEANGYTVVRTYIDRAKSATTDKRPNFQAMIADAKEGCFDVIIVHKLDRFSRDRYNSAIYRHQLKLCGVQLLSVTERIDGSPESLIMESVIEAMAEYFSVNLAREVRKGLSENALKGNHVGGRAPLGYDVDPVTRKLILNEREAAAVKLIFSMYNNGSGYTEIIDELNLRGFKTKAGNAFGKGSLYDVLRNEKYTGVYIYNKTASKSPDNKFNRHAYKDEDEIIRVDGAVPVIVSPEDFASVQKKMEERRHRAARYTAKETYLLTGKMVCGECGASFVGNSQIARNGNPQYVSYRCNKKHGSVKCTNPSVRREAIEPAVIDYLCDNLFNEALLPTLLDRYNQFTAQKASDSGAERAQILSQLTPIDHGIDNIVSAIASTGSIALAAKLKELESEKIVLSARLAALDEEAAARRVTMEQITVLFRQGKAMLKSGSLNNQKAVIDQYVKNIVVHRESIDCYFNALPRMETEVNIPRESLKVCG